MQRQFCVKLLSKITRNGSSSSVASSIVPEPLFPSSLLMIKANPVYQQSRHSAVSRSHLWKLYGYNGISGGSQHGFFLNPALARRAFSNALLKGQTNQGGRNFRWFDSRNHGWRSEFNRLTAGGVVIGLIVTNVAIFILWRVASPQFMVKNFMISVDNFTSGRVHTLITSAFSHRDILHLMSNMVGLYFFGLSIGRAYGPEYLLTLYLSGALVGSIFYLGYHAFVAPRVQKKPLFGVDPSRVPGLGASGAVNAILLLDIFLFPTKTLLFDFFIPVPAIFLGIFIIGKDVLRILEGDREISGSAHLGGAVVAALAWAQKRKGHFRRF